MMLIINCELHSTLHVSLTTELNFFQQSNATSPQAVLTSTVIRYVSINPGIIFSFHIYKNKQHTYNQLMFCRKFNEAKTILGPGVA